LLGEQIFPAGAKALFVCGTLRLVQLDEQIHRVFLNDSSDIERSGASARVQSGPMARSITQNGTNVVSRGSTLQIAGRTSTAPHAIDSYLPAYGLCDGHRWSCNPKG
jgi:hypothetical protein